MHARAGSMRSERRNDESNMDMVRARAVTGWKSERREMACPGNSPGVVEAGGSNHAGTRGRRPVPCMASIAALRARCRVSCHDGETRLVPATLPFISAGSRAGKTTC